MCVCVYRSRERYTRGRGERRLLRALYAGPVRFEPKVGRQRGRGCLVVIVGWWEIGWGFEFVRTNFRIRPLVFGINLSLIIKWEVI